MARLNKANAKAASEKADEWNGSGIVQPGIYLCKLVEVDSTRSGPSGPYWTWTYETVGVGDEPVGKRFWDNTSLSEKAIGRLGKVFAAFGVGTDTDTDDLIGGLIAIEVKIGTISAGQNAGQQRNEVVAHHLAASHPLFDEYEGEVPSETAAADDFD